MSVIDSNNNYALVVDEVGDTFIVKYLTKVGEQFVYSNDTSVVNQDEVDFYLTEEEGLNTGGYFRDECGEIKESDPDYEPSEESESSEESDVEDSEEDSEEEY